VLTKKGSLHHKAKAPAPWKVWEPSAEKITMTDIIKNSAPVNRSAAETEARQLREAFLNALRAASARTKLFANVIDSGGTRAGR
jgi:hypothetical protein